MFRHWEKVQCTLRWKLVSVDLKKHVKSEFQMSWNRGSSAKGQSDTRRPDRAGVIVFDCEFEAKATVFISRTDGQIRPKRLNLVLRRFPDSHASVIYGKLSIDVGRYYRNKEPVQESIEMESGRSTAPVVTAVFQFVEVGTSTAGSETDNSYYEEDPQRVALSDWDKTEIEKLPTPEDEPPKKKKKKHRKSGREEAESPAPVKPKPPPDAQAPPQNGSGTQSAPSDMPRAPSEIPGPASKMPEPAPSDNSAPLRLDIPEVPSLDDGKKRHRVKKKETEIPDINAPLPPEPEPEPDQRDVIQLIRSVLARPWDGLYDKVFLDSSRKFPFPPAVFPIFAIIRHTRLFDPSVVPDEQFADAIDTFFEELDEAPLSPDNSADHRFLTCLVVALLIDGHAKNEGWQDARVARTLDRFVVVFNQGAQVVLAPALRNFDVLCNRFATAKFDVEPLLDDFRLVLDGVYTSVEFPRSVTRYLMEHLVALLDTKILNRIIANPGRFLFTNAVAWNTFITAFEGVTSLNFKYLRQAVFVLVMAKNLTDPDAIDGIVESVCPDLDKKLIFNFLKNYHPDSMLPEPINFRAFGDKFGFKDVSTLQAVAPHVVQSFRSVAAHLPLDAWNHVVLTPVILRGYPFFQSQAKPV
jgi:hypothetical protein